MIATLKKILLTFVLLIFALPAFGQLSGTFSVGEGETYTTLKAAFDDAMAQGVNGDVTFLITSDLTEAENVFLGINPDPYTITVKPAEGTTPVVEFTQTVGNDNINGALVIGATGDSWDDLVHTENIIFDGSNAVDGSSRDLTLRTHADVATNHGFRIVGSTDNVQLKNSVITLQNSAFDGLLVTSVGDAENGSQVSKNVLIENNAITNDTRSSARAIILRDAFDEITDDFPTITVSNNDILGRRYGVWVRESGGNADIFGNAISVNEQNGLSAVGILVDENVSSENTVNIYNNTFPSLATNGEVNGIEVRGQGVANIYNNFITGFEVNTTSDADDVYFYGILIRQPDDPDFNDTIQANVYHNTVYMNPLEYTGGEGWRYRGIQMNSNARISSDIRNNIVVNADENPEVTSYALFRFGTGGSWSSDYNNIFITLPDEATETYLAFWDSESYTTLGQWTEGSGNGENSSSINVAFADETAGDLRLAGVSIGEDLLRALPVEGVTVDIDGNERDEEFPYMGAHEPEDESTSVDDFVSTQPENHQLNQNYPNPFNPTTTIDFKLTNSSDVELSIYNMLGQKVAVLAEGRLSSGTHSMVWDASSVSSGVYIATLRAGDVTLHRKMTLIK